MDRRAVAAGRAPLQRFLHILARAKGPAGAGENRDFQVRIILELGEGRRHLAPKLKPQRIHPFGPVQADRHDLSTALRFHHRHHILSHFNKSGRHQS